MSFSEQVIQHSRKWILDVVIGCNFCPFAAKPYKDSTIYYCVDESVSLKDCLTVLINECTRLDEDEKVETVLIIYPRLFDHFQDYLDMIALAEKLLKKEGYEGIYQVASFHPNYCFAGSEENDPANFTNRSVYPMLHILREASVEIALKKYTEPENIPERNIQFARGKGELYMKMLRQACME